jgi:transcriptional regulator with GAF, ATPase, and Fis domain
MVEMSSTLKESTTSTLSHSVTRQGTGRTRLAPHLFLVLQADQPLAASARYCLENVHSLSLGRAPEGNTARFERSEGHAFKLTVPDRWMSSSHAVLRRDLGQWVLEDAKSKNGTLVNGGRHERAVLADGDLVELGHTFFIFRQAIDTEEGAASLEVGELRSAAPGLATLVPSLATEFRNLEAIAPSSVSVVVHGETGTGKELVAQAIHKLSHRTGTFVAVNCAALTQTLVESELFGYRKGAFSGATEDRIGLIRSADRGTLFLDEIGDLPASAQAVFLRVLQESEVLPVGGTHPVKVDLRVLAATHRDLPELVEANQFRADLLARISGLTLTLPPLRARREDLGLLAGMLLRRHVAKRGEPIHFSSDAARAMLLYRWPLNIRELEKCLTAAVVLARGGPVELIHFPRPVQAALEEPKSKDAPQTDGADENLEGPLSDEDQRRREEILGLLSEHGGNVTAVARVLGKARFQVQRWLKRYRIDPTSFRR